MEYFRSGLYAAFKRHAQRRGQQIEQRPSLLRHGDGLNHHQWNRRCDVGQHTRQLFPGRREFAVRHRSRSRSAGLLSMRFYCRFRAQSYAGSDKRELAALRSDLSAWPRYRVCRLAWLEAKGLDPEKVVRRPSTTSSMHHSDVA